MTIDNSWTRKAKDTSAGFVGGAVQVLVGQPFDLVKVRLQTGQFSSPIEAVTQTIKHEGLLAFYKGTTAPLIGVGACVSVQFYAFHETRRRILQANNTAQLTYPQFYLAGASAGLANTVISAPVEQLRILLQTQKTKTYNGPIDAIRKIVKLNGFQGLFRGFGITAVREAQAYGVWFLTYEYLISQAVKKVAREEIPTWQLMAFGGLAGEALWLASYPLDVLKSQVQSDKFGPDRKYHGAWDAAKKTYAAKGIAGFWKGIGPTLLRAVPASASTFASVELTLRLLG
jgi:solute carrier family 25 (mitochondrial carnitine/acylcarnitine transporter), member 20/29